MNTTGAWGMGGECGAPACDWAVLAYDELVATAEAQHGHPGDDCPASPPCVARLERRFLLERHEQLCAECLRALALPVLGSGVWAMDRASIVRFLEDH